ncbi:fibronectin type 3 and ankyrin repeat domains protein 1-like [Tubulanus polymorphus]|uniref:fibronectin type 3 and ankyrin repeat domains protein 1-like n=1 Tax=Tubulanus polymorphus TaxID=672921 RepID=UPI003DA24CF3
MAAPPRPPAPIVGKVTHHTILISWVEAYERLSTTVKKGDGRIRVVLQEEDKSCQWGNAYTGYAKSHVVEGLEALTKYRFRMCFKNDHGESDWSAPVVVMTTKEPLTGVHLHKAVIHRDIDGIEKVLNTSDVNIDVNDKSGNSPLMVASQKGYLDVVNALIKRGADVNLQDETGKTSLMLACYAGRLNIVEILRENQASYTIKDKNGAIAIHSACDGQNLEVIKYLIDDGADVNARDTTSGWTPLHRCAAIGGNKEVANLLIRKGAVIESKDNDGKTPLMIAVVYGHQGLVELLLHYKADIYATNVYGKSIYEMALSMERQRVIKTIEDHMQLQQVQKYEFVEGEMT